MYWKSIFSLNVYGVRLLVHIAETYFLQMTKLWFPFFLTFPNTYSGSDCCCDLCLCSPAVSADFTLFVVSFFGGQSWQRAWVFVSTSVFPWFDTQKQGAGIIVALVDLTNSAGYSFLLRTKGPYVKATFLSATVCRPGQVLTLFLTLFLNNLPFVIMTSVSHVSFSWATARAPSSSWASWTSSCCSSGRHISCPHRSCKTRAVITQR